MAVRTSGDTCVASAHSAFKEDDLSKTPDIVREWLWNDGRPRATVEYAQTQAGDHQVALHFKLQRTDPLKVGKLVIRGNFRTADRVILDELGLHEGDELTADTVADGGRKLRATGLFDDVHVELPDLETTTESEVHGVVRVQERYDYHAQVDFEAGDSSYSGWYGKIIPGFKNILGYGISADLAGTVGSKIQAAELTIRFPRWMSREFLHVPRMLDFQTELDFFDREQLTPAFGKLDTLGLTVAISHNVLKPRTKDHDASSYSVGLHYDLRVRQRQIDATRPDAGDDDSAQIPVSTRTGSIGLSGEYEARVDTAGNLSPLAPDRGFRLQGAVSYASPILDGQDTFMKLLAAFQGYKEIGALLLNLNLHYDQGIPLGGAVLLPDVERFFAGGDTTVRGYNDDQLAHEIIQVGVPPLGTVSQIRVLPAGGNIRVMGSLDAQIRIYKLLASGVFFDAGMIQNQWRNVGANDLRPAVGISFARIVTPFGAFAFEYAIPLHPELGDDPRGRFHVSFAAHSTF
jgi:outer membrane protein insertion porin family